MHCRGSYSHLPVRSNVAEASHDQHRGFLGRSFHGNHENCSRHVREPRFQSSLAFVESFGITGTDFSSDWYEMKMTIPKKEFPLSGVHFQVQCQFSREYSSHFLSQIVFSLHAYANSSVPVIAWRLLFLLCLPIPSMYGVFTSIYHILFAIKINQM